MCVYRISSTRSILIWNCLFERNWQKELERQLEQENEELKARDEITEYEQPLPGDENHDEDNVMYQNYPTEQEHAATQG